MGIGWKCSCKGGFCQDFDCRYTMVVHISKCIFLSYTFIYIAGSARGPERLVDPTVSFRG